MNRIQGRKKENFPESEKKRNNPRSDGMKITAFLISILLLGCLICENVLADENISPIIDARINRYIKQLKTNKDFHRARIELIDEGSRAVPCLVATLSSPETKPRMKRIIISILGPDKGSGGYGCFGKSA